MVDIDGEKAPGPDGLSGLFFQKAWSTIKTDVPKAVQDFTGMNTSEFGSLNTTTMILIQAQEARSDAPS
jgi:hypothetical protein